MSSCLYSLVIPVYNEEESLRPLFKEICQVLNPLERNFEVIFVNDCSFDRSAELLERFKREWPEIVKPIHLAARAGQTFALREGLGQAKGEIVMTLDADLQNDPADILKLITKIKGDFDCVCGWRKRRKDTWIKSFLSKLANVTQRTLTRLAIHDVSCTLRAYKRSCLEHIPLHWDGQHRFIPLSLALRGFKVGEIEVNHRFRQFGQSKYSHRRIGKVMVDFFRVFFTKGR